MESWLAILAFVSGFLIAQVWKFIGTVMKGRRGAQPKSLGEMIGDFMHSGGMPSGHTASMAALTTYLGCVSGFSSGVFALAVASLIIVAYDAIHVRYAVGEQGKALNGLLKEAGKPELPLVEGHTFKQMLVGLVLGVVVGAVIYMVSSGA